MIIVNITLFLEKNQGVGLKVRVDQIIEQAFGR